MRSIAKLIVLATLPMLVWSASASAASLVPIGEFDQPIFVTSAPASPGELLIVEREGRVIRDEGGDIGLYGDLSSLVACCESERGLLSIAPAPDFASSGRFYAAYAGNDEAGGEEGDIHVDSFRPSGAGSGALIREPILTVPHAENPNHNGGQLQFGPDGHLYVSLGDGGGGGDPAVNGQDVESLLGKILRIDPHPGSVPAYAIPPGNPFAAGPGRDEIWAYGLRNPWRFSFDRLSGDLVVADVGQGLREEVDFAPSPSPGAVGGAGANYGWNCREGFIAYPGAPGDCAGAGGFVDPVFDYPHDDPGGGQAYGCAIIGGYVVHDANLGDLDGRYVYSDSCNGEIRSLVLPANSGEGATGDRSESLAVPGPTSFGEDSCGRTYVAAGDGTVYRIEGSAGAACPPPPGASGKAPVVVTLRPVDRRKRVEVRLRVRRRRHSPLIALIASVSPCAENAGARLLLRRGGRRFAGKRLDAKCVAYFRVRPAAKATFRALFAGQRSQVRTIALAKPRP